MNYYLSLIGYHGPINLLLLILIMFSVTKTVHAVYLCIFVIVWQLINIFINVVIKNTLKSPRPDSYKNKNFKNLTPTMYNYFDIHRNFGMPSGHAQAVISEVTFILLYFKRPIITTFSIMQACITLWQRYITRRHSAKQLLVGSIIGIATGMGFYKMMPIIINHIPTNK